MQRGRDRPSVAGARRSLTRRSSAAVSNFTPNARNSVAGATGNTVRKSYLPRPGFGSAGPSNNAGRGRRSVESQGAASGGGPVRGRLSSAAMGNSRSSIASNNGALLALAGNRASGSNAGLAPSGTRTPRNNTTAAAANNYLAPPMSVMSAMSNRLSTDSRRASNTGRRKRKDPRPVGDPAFKKSCIDIIFNFLVETGYSNEGASVFSRKTIINPTTRDFVSIFSFIYKKIDPSFEMPSRFDEEIPKLMKQMQYPVQLPKSTFVTIGSPHTWPTLLALLAWLCVIAQDLLTNNIKELAFPANFDSPYNSNWEVLCLCKDVLSHCNSEDYVDERFRRYKEELERERGVSEGQLATVREEVAKCKRTEDNIKRQIEEHSLLQLQNTNESMRLDIAKIKDYQLKLQKKIDQQNNEHEAIEASIVEQQQLLSNAELEYNRLRSLKESQPYTTAEVRSIKTHALTSAATEVQLKKQGKQLQEKIWSAEMLLVQSRVTLAELVREYNSQDVAAVVGCIRAPHSDVPENLRGGAENLEEYQLDELAHKLQEHLRVSRSKLMEMNERKSKQQDELRKWSEKIRASNLEIARTTSRLANIEEDIAYCTQENDTEEAALQQRTTQLNAMITTLRRGTNTNTQDLHSLKQQLLHLKNDLQKKKSQLEHRVTVCTAALTRISQKVEEQLKWEEKSAASFTAAMTKVSLSVRLQSSAKAQQESSINKAPCDSHNTNASNKTNVSEDNISAKQQHMVLRNRNTTNTKKNDSSGTSNKVKSIISSHKENIVDV